MDAKGQPPFQAPLEVARHYQRLLVLKGPVGCFGVGEGYPARQRVDLQLVHAPGTRFACPHGRQECAVHDHAPDPLPGARGGQYPCHGRAFHRAGR